MKVTLTKSLLLLFLNFKLFSCAAITELYDLTADSEDDSEMKAEERVIPNISLGSGSGVDVIDRSTPPTLPRHNSSSEIAGNNLQVIANSLLSFTTEQLTLILTGLGPEEYMKPLKFNCIWNLLHEAVFTDNLQIADLLIEKFGFDPNAWDPQFGNCVYLVSSVQMVKMLQARGTDFSINTTCFMYLNPSESALMRNNFSFLASQDDFNHRLNHYLNMIHAQQADNGGVRFEAAPDKMYGHFLRKLGKFGSLRNPSAKIQVIYTGQPGIDQGGLTKSFITQMKNEMKNGGKVFQSDPDTGVLNFKIDAPLDQVKAAGFIVGLSIYNKVPLSLLFSPIIYHLIAAKNIHRDINYVSVARETSVAVMKSYENIKKSSDAALDTVEFPDLPGDGLRSWKRRRTCIGTRENISDYIKISAKDIVYGQRAKEYQAFLLGLRWAINFSEIGHYLTIEELKKVIGGELEDYTAADMRNNVEFLQHIDIFPQQYEWLFEIIDEFTPKQRRLFLKYFTSLECLPIGGFAALDEKIKVEMLTCDDDPDKYFPEAATCTNTFKIYPYTSKEVMKAKFIESIENYVEGFHMA